MFLYRISKRAHIKDLSGSGARLYGGRWNHRGVPLVYSSESRSLATVEFLVHVSLPNAPGDLSMATLEVPENITPKELNPSSLPKNWRDSPAPIELADLGTQWARSNTSLLLRVPSAVVEYEHNILINPLHQDLPRVKLVKVAPYKLDERLMRR
jgi:RES domain-containing protein